MQISIEEVNNILASAPSARANSVKGNISQNTSPSSVTGNPSVKLDISSQAQDIQRVRKELEQGPEVRMDRVNALKQQISDGTYKVSSNQIADLMLRRTLADNTAF